VLWGKQPWNASNDSWSNSGSILTHYPLVTPAEGVVTKNFLKYLDNTGLTKNIFRVGHKAVLLQMSHIVSKFLGQNPWPLGIQWIFFPSLSAFQLTIWDGWMFPRT